MTNYQQKKSLSVMTVDELKELIREHNLGGEIDYDVKHVYGEILFRDMLKRKGRNYVQDEPMIDSFIDIANYGIIAMLVMKGKWKK